MSEYIITDKQLKTATEAYLEHELSRPITAVFISGDKLPEIVRCRDCLKWDYDSPYPKKACFEFSNPEDGYIVMTSSDGFCAWPERRTE